MKRKNPLRKLGHNDLPATVGLVKAVRSELLADIRAVKEEIHSVREEVSSVREDVTSLRQELRHEIKTVRHDMNSMEARLGAKIEQVTSAVHRVQVIVEEQRSENRIVLDGLKTVIDRQDRFEAQYPLH